MLFFAEDINISLLLIYFIATTAIIFISNRHKIINLYDPIIPKFLIFICGLAGYFCIGTVFKGETFRFSRIAFISMFVVGTFYGNFKNNINIKLNLKISHNLQLIYVIILVCLVLLEIFVNNIIPGEVPVLQPYSAIRRIGATQNSRLLLNLAASVNYIGVVFYALSDYKDVKRWALSSVLISLAKTILMASKAFILQGFLLYLGFIFLKGLKDNCNKCIKFNVVKSQKKKSTIKIFFFGFLVVVLLPLTLQVMGYENPLLTIIWRFFAGLDNFIMISMFDIDLEYKFKEIGVGMFKLYFMPFFKILGGHSFAYNSTSEYIFEEAFNITHKQALPNSNLIIELIMTNGYIASILISTIVFSAAMSFRKKLLKLKHLNLLSCIFLYYMVFSPFGLILYGYQEFLRIFMAVLICFFAYLLEGFLRLTLRKTSNEQRQRGKIRIAN